MQIVTCCFDYEDRPEFCQLLDVFRHSVKRLMPRVEFVELRPIAPPVEYHRVHGFLDNTFKLDAWVKHLDNTDQPVIFADCDMLALRSAEHAFDLPFDIAYTGCPDGYKVPLNGGILMARPTVAARRFMHNLRIVNSIMFHDSNFHEKWRDKYAGMNQSAFGCLLEIDHAGAAVHRYDTREWNAIDCDLRAIGPDTVFIHVRQRLRQQLLAGLNPGGIGAEAMRLWYAERELMQPGSTPKPSAQAAHTLMRSRRRIRL